MRERLAPTEPRANHENRIYGRFPLQAWPGVDFGSW
jgi:hypothetical protein